MNNQKVLSLISSKGGSGKTILTATIGAILAQIGKKVLLVDADAATNGLSLFYLDDILFHFKNNKKATGIFSTNYYVDSKSFVNVNKNLDLLPATFEFKNTIDVPPKEFSIRIENLIEYLYIRGDYDYILIDNQAGTEYYTEYVIKRTISDEVLIVSEYDPISAAGIERMKGFFNDDLTYDRTWIILNKVLPEFKNADTTFLEISKYLPPIIWNSHVVRSYARKDVPLDFNYGNDYTLSLIKLIRALFGKSIKLDLEIWLKDKESMVKKPIYDQYTKLKAQLIKYEKEGRGIRIDIMSLFIFGVGLIIIITFAFTSFSLLNFENIALSRLVMIIIALSSFIITLITRLIQTIKKNIVHNEYEIEISALRKKIEEIEIIKQSSIEEILERKNGA